MKKILTVFLIIILSACSGNKPTIQETINKPVQREIRGAKNPNLSHIDDLSIPEYNGKPYIVVNNGLPLFKTENLTPEFYEIYYDLDELGRATLADAVVGPETLADGKRGDISMIKPSGWHSDRYDFVNGEALYNRCHLIAHYIGDEDANKYNFVTGTRYMNEDGMNLFENLVGDYIKETNNHVRYRVTPLWTNENLICDGLLVEAFSIEDKGDGICFCIYCYNVQPGIYIDYLTGDNHALENDSDENDINGHYVLNVNSKRFHLPDCKGVEDISPDNKEEYKGSRNKLIKEGYKPCGSCNP